MLHFDHLNRFRAVIKARRVGATLFAQKPPGIVRIYQWGVISIIAYFGDLVKRTVKINNSGMMELQARLPIELAGLKALGPLLMVFGKKKSFFYLFIIIIHGEIGNYVLYDRYHSSKFNTSNFF